VNKSKACSGLMCRQSLRSIKAVRVALQRDYLKARAEVNLQVSVWKRDKKLSDAGSISERRWQETRFNHDTAQAEYAGLRGQLMLAGLSEADLKRLADEMEIGPDIILRAPADAIVLARPRNAGGPTQWQ
jgi:multidrug resistance efflux pump